MKHGNGFYDEIKIVTDYSLELFNGIEDIPRLILLRIDIMKVLMEKTKTKFMEFYKFTDEEIKGEQEILSIIDKNIETGFVVVNKK